MMKYLFLFLKWLFTMADRSGLQIEIVSESIRLRGGNGIPLQDEVREEFHHWITKEAVRFSVPVVVQMREDGIYIEYSEEEEDISNENKTDSSLQQSGSNQA